MSRRQRTARARGRRGEIPQPPGRKRSALSRAMLWGLEIVIVILFAFLLVYFFGQSRTNIGQSMSVTLSGGDTVLLDTFSYQIGSPKRGDIIAFKPGGSETSHSYIKRVIGLPGETIQIIDGMIYINDELYLEEADYPAINDPGMAAEPITLGSDEYFVLGDNRNDSQDSRFADVGNVRRSYIEGRVWLVLGPRNHFGLVS